MFTNTKARMATTNPDTIYFNAACLSTDAKPTVGVRNGSTCIEMDTGKRYMFNEEGSEWIEFPSSGGGGGGGNRGYLMLTYTFDGEFSNPGEFQLSCDHQMSEIKQAIEDGRVVKAHIDDQSGKMYIGYADLQYYEEYEQDFTVRFHSFSFTPNDELDIATLATIDIEHYIYFDDEEQAMVEGAVAWYVHAPVALEPQD